MNNINKSFININDNEMSKEKCIDFVLDCNLEYLKQKNFIDSERQSIAQDFIKYKNFVNVNQFRNNINKKESRSLNSTDYNLEKMAQDSIINIDDLPAQVRKSVDSPPGMLTEDHHHTVHEERQVCYSSHLRPKSLHL